MESRNNPFAIRGLPEPGVCRFGDVLPLLDCRGRARLPERAQSVLVYLFPYYAGEFPRRNVAYYAMLDDYHRVAGGMLRAAAEKLEGLYPQERFASFIDSSPIREREAARLAGLGVIGRHGQLLHAQYGSRVFIGAIVTTLTLEAGTPGNGTCLDCGACLAACPTGALKRDRPLREERCRSHITQKKGELTPWEREQIHRGGLVWGCDLCTDACPMNQNPPVTPVAAFREDIVPVFRPAEAASLIKRKPYGWRGKGVLLRNWELVGGSALQTPDESRDDTGQSSKPQD